MTKQVQPVTLMGYFAIPLLGKCAKKKLFGGSVIRFPELVDIMAQVYQCGAILGHAKRDKLTILAKLLHVQEGKEDQYIECMQQNAQKRLTQFGSQPNSLYELFYLTELEKLGFNLLNMFEWDSSKWTNWQRFSKEEISLKKTSIQQNILDAGNEGVGFGSIYPELIENIFEDFRGRLESTSPDGVADILKQGFDIDKDSAPTFEERENTILSITANFTNEFYPMLMEPLGLHKYLVKSTTSNLF